MKALLRRVLNRWPLLKRAVLTVRACVFPRVAVSSHYVALSGEGAQDEAQRLRASWQDEQLPARQRELVERELRLYRSGGAVDVFDVLVKALRELPDLTPGSSILEVGCSSGFYSEVLSIAQLPLAYEGCDYSAAFIEMARRSYPSLKFEQQDATQLQYPEDGFDVVVSGCCLLHIPEYAVAVQETARVARHYAVFHRTPVVWGQPEQWYRKQAYGVETVEIHFNEPEFLALLDRSGLALIATYTLSEERDSNHPQQGRAVRTYVCKTKPS